MWHIKLRGGGEIFCRDIDELKIVVGLKVA